MKFTSVPAASLCLVGACASLLLPTAGSARVRHHRPAVVRPVLVELYTAQGCEGCPQADLALGELAKKKSVVALTFSVDIWDYTGWSDTFAQPEFTARQQAYVKRMKLREIYTPEVVVDGAAEAAGSDKDAVAELIAKAGKAAISGPKVTLNRDGDKVSVAAARAPVAAEVWLVRYDPKPREVKVKAGDNKGKTVVVANAVKELAKLGLWRGKAKRYDLPDATAEGLKTVVLVQGARGGPVLSLGKD
jgi:hypothetical protein